MDFLKRPRVEKYFLQAIYIGLGLYILPVENPFSLRHMDFLAIEQASFIYWTLYISLGFSIKYNFIEQDIGLFIEAMTMPMNSRKP